MRQLIPVFLWCSVALFATSMCGCQRHLSATKMAAHAEAQAEDSLFWGVTLAPPIIEEGVINHLLATSGAITPQKDETLSFVVPRMDGISALLVGDSLEWSFRSPSGRIILPGITPNSADYEYDGANGMAGFMLRDPTVGVWTATLRSPKPDSAAAYGVDLQVEGSPPERAHLETMVRGGRPDG